jgi:hypothetical protein
MRTWHIPKRKGRERTDLLVGLAFDKMQAPFVIIKDVTTNANRGRRSPEKSIKMGMLNDSASTLTFHFTAAHESSTQSPAKLRYRPMSNHGVARPTNMTNVHTVRVASQCRCAHDVKVKKEKQVENMESAYSCPVVSYESQSLGSSQPTHSPPTLKMSYISKVRTSFSTQYVRTVRTSSVRHMH